MMDERELAGRVLELCRSADRLRMPDHRHGAEAFLVSRDQVRDEARRLYRDLTGSWPGQDGREAGPARRVQLPIPAAIARDRARAQPAAGKRA